MALYPPIVASSMPAFDISDGKVRIYYTLSTYNTSRRDDITAVHVTVRRQSSNVNVLSSATQIVQKSFGLQQNIDKTLNRYYIDITTDDLISEGFQVDALYKVQLRFSSVVGSNTSTFYTDNINNFSEWSTVCIIKPIQVPTFYIDDFYTGQPPKQTDVNNFYSTLADFIGIYKQEKSTQTLRYWRLRLLSENYTEEDILNIDNFVLSDSGRILNSTSNYNLEDNSVVLSCSLPYELKQDNSYKLLFEIETKNGYKNSLLYPFTCSQSNVNELTGELSTYINEEQGYIKLIFTSDEVYMGNLVVRRTDSKSGFLKWEDLKYFEVYNNPGFEYYDFTAESGLFYRYLVQKVDARGRRGTPVYDQSRHNQTGVMAEWEHAFLLETTGNGQVSGTKQLKLKYDFQISSYKTNISESRTDTIGSRYPFIRRNGNMYYRSFPVTGTITEYMDDANLFTDSNALFDGYYNKYKNFKGQIDEYVNRYDYTYERKFREKVEEFLYNAKPKLYKSMQQGNIFIKLMQVSLTPKNELGRLVYSFSATAYEIDEASVNTFNNYGLISIGTFNPNIYTTSTIFSQISSYDFNDNIEGNMFKAGQDIIGAGQTPAANSIAKSIKYNESFNNKIVTDFNINWLRLTIESQPYLIIEQNGTYRPFDDIDSDGSDPIDFTQPIDYQLYQIESTYNGVNVYLGWLFTINGQQIIISPPNNIYELKEDAFTFKRDVQIIPAKDTAMLVDYRLINVVEEDLSSLPKNIRINKVNGQLIGKYSEETELISRINYKYKYTYESGKDKVERYVNGVNTVLVDTEPGTIIYLKTSVMNNPQRFVVNETGELNFDPNDSTIYINSLKVTGMNVSLADCNKKENVQSLEDIPYPRNKDYCQIDNNFYYYHKAEWVPAVLAENEKSLDVSCAVDALVFYFASIRENIY